MSEDAVRAAVEGAEEWEPLDEALARQSRNDLGNAERLIARHGGDLLWVEELGWLAWDGRRWAVEGGRAEAIKRAHLTVKALSRELAAVQAAGPRTDAEGAALETAAQFAKRLESFAKFASAAGNGARIAAMVDQAAPYLRRAPRELDAAPYRLTVANGTVDLAALVAAEPGADDGDEDGGVKALRRHDRRHQITRMAGAEWVPAAPCPTWLRVLADVLPDPEVRAFFQRWCGYCLSGDISEQAIVIAYGTGANGKSTVLNGFREVLADYAAAVPIATFLHDERRSGGDATPDLARLRGVRLVLASEPNEGDRLGESVIKSLTGGEAVPVRHLFRDMFELRPTFKIIVSCNHKPRVRGQDHGIWRRLLMLPFTVTIPEDRKIPMEVLVASFRAEAAGILAWAADGFRMWREQGLAPPPAVREAVDAYRAESDPLGDFLSECVRTVPNGRIQAKRLHAAYCHWAKGAALDPVTATGFGRRLAARGFRRDKRGAHFWLGLELNLTADALAGFELPV